MQVPVVAQQVPPPHVPSPVWPHAEVHVPEALQVGVPFEQPPQAAPVLPQVPLLVPATHCPFSGLQQPPLHTVSLVPPHARPQACVVVLHASSAGQSLCVLHPHCASPLTQAVPLAFPAQLTQAVPQAVGPSATHALP
jgi:hypothetical protein